MTTLDWIVVGIFFVVMIGIGIFTSRVNHSSEDFFVGGGKIPWWLSGISHHVSGHSGVVFVAYAAVAYEFGITIYFWWAVVIGIAMLLGAKFVAPRWPRLREKLGVQSPIEYMAIRYGLPAQQVTAWFGIISKLIDIGAKWASMGILLNGFTGVPIWLGMVLSGAVSLIYITVGGIWADMLTDFVQFLVQLVAGIALLIGVFSYLGGPSTMITMWSDLPEGHSNPFNGPYTATFAILYLVVKFIEYNGGQWNLAQRFISNPDGNDSRKAANLSAILYFVWPLLIFLPMWAGPLLFPNLDDPAAQLYPALTTSFLPSGLVGLVLAAMFASTMGMTVSDINSLTAVFQRDVLPLLSKKFKEAIQGEKMSLHLARLITIILTIITIIVGIYQDKFGGVLGMIVNWVAALVSLCGVGIVLGLFPKFKYSNGKVVIISLIGGLSIFTLTKVTNLIPYDLQASLPVLTTLAIYLIGGYINKKRNATVSPEVEELLKSISTEKIVTKKDRNSTTIAK